MDRILGLLELILKNGKEVLNQMPTIQETLDKLAADEVTVATGLTTIGKQLSDEFTVISTGLASLEAQLTGPQPDPSAAVANLAQIQTSAANFQSLLATMQTAAGTLPGQPQPAKSTS